MRKRLDTVADLQGGKKKTRQKIPEQSSARMKVQVHLDKVIDHQGSRGKNCTRKGREKKKKKITNWPFLCKRQRTLNSDVFLTHIIPLYYFGLQISGCSHLYFYQQR